MTKSIALSVLAAAAFTGVASAQELITNGSFETGDMTGWSFYNDPNFVGVESPMAFWAIPAVDGEYAAFFGCQGYAGGMQQSVTANVGDQLTVSFWLGSRAGSPPNEIDIRFDGVQLLGGTDVGAWSAQFYSYDVTVTSANPTLILSFRYDDQWFYVDAVSVTPVPTPGAAAALGLAGLGTLRRRRR